MARGRALASALLAVLLAASVSGCGGWYLRGQGPRASNLRQVFIKSADAEEVGRAVRSELVNRGLRVARRRGDAQVVVEIDGERYERRVLSVDPETGKVREIELALEAYFTVRSADGRLLVPREPLDWQLDYVFDEGSVLGTVEQDQTVQRDLAEIAATTLVLRVQSLDLPPPREEAAARAAPSRRAAD